MRAAIFQQVGKPLSIENVPDPRPAEGELIIEVVRAGVCGSDLHWTETPGILGSGRILGHEFSGIVADSNGSGMAAGTRVTALPIHPCWNCEECDGGHIFHCAHAANVGLHRDGAFAKALSVDARLVQPLPEGVSFEEGALIEPLAVGYRTVSHARNLRGAKVLLMGAGPIGSAVLLFAILGGAVKVIVSEPSPGRRAMAENMGATATINPREEDLGKRFAELAGGPPDIVIECVGYPGVLAEAIRHVRHRGQILSAGGSYQPDTFTPIDALTKELVISFSCAYEERDFEAVANALAREGINPQPLITDRVTLDQLPASFEALRTPSSQCKLIVEI